MKNKLNYDNEDLILISTRIPKDFKRALKLRCTIDGVSFQDKMIDIISAYLLLEYKNSCGEQAFDKLVKEIFPSFKKVVK